MMSFASDKSLNRPKTLAGGRPKHDRQAVLGWLRGRLASGPVPAETLIEDVEQATFTNATGTKYRGSRKALDAARQMVRDEIITHQQDRVTWWIDLTAGPQRIPSSGADSKVAIFAQEASRQIREDRQRKKEENAAAVEAATHPPATEEQLTDMAKTQQRLGGVTPQQCLQVLREYATKYPAAQPLHDTEIQDIAIRFGPRTKADPTKEAF